MRATGIGQAIRATGLRKSFGTHQVLDGIDLSVGEGTVFALLGPNGAGKTTTVHILSTLITADDGQVEVARPLSDCLGPSRQNRQEPTL